METITELLKQDITSIILGMFIIMSGIIAMATVIGKFSELIGRPVRWVRTKNADHILIMENTDAIKSILESIAVRDEQIDNLMNAQREVLADKINRKYKYYISINGIPEDEVDEFTNLHAAYKGCGGNHSGDIKYEYCINHLPVIPVETKLLIKTEDLNDGFTNY